MSHFNEKNLLLDFLKFHYKENPHRRSATNEKDVDDYLSQKQKDESVDEQTDDHTRLMEGRHYLMGVEPNDLTVEDALVAFGFGKNGLNF